MEKSFRTAIRVTWILTAVCLLATGAMFVLPKFGIDWREHFSWLFFSAPVLFFCFFLLPLLYYYRKRYLTGEKELLQGEQLARWHYHPDEWKKFAETEWLRTRKQAMWTPAGVVVGVVVLGYLFKGWGADEFSVVLPWILAIAVVVALLMYSYGLRNYKKSVKKVGEVFIGKSGLYFNDAYYTWNVVGTKLGKVELLEGDPRILQFEILYASKTGPRPSEIRVPVPRAHEQEAEKIIQKLSK